MTNYHKIHQYSLPCMRLLGDSRRGPVDRLSKCKIFFVLGKLFVGQDFGRTYHTQCGLSMLPSHPRYAARPCHLKDKIRKKKEKKRNTTGGWAGACRLDYLIDKPKSSINIRTQSMDHRIEYRCRLAKALVLLKGQRIFFESILLLSSFFRWGFRHHDTKACRPRSNRNIE